MLTINANGGLCRILHLLGLIWRCGPSRAIVVSDLPLSVRYRIGEKAGRTEVITVAHVRQRPHGCERWLVRDKCGPYESLSKVYLADQLLN